mmetsp:Transcript_83206/g.146725  ORF Transcript_83206/g.146725 Transcript_83206/m.146725 type:complete len:346 (-) Transcript_83206:297-1334(-)
MKKRLQRKSAIIIEVGAGYTKCGVAGEAEPRSIIRTHDTVRALLLAQVFKSAALDDNHREVHSFVQLLIEQLRSSVNSRQVILCCNANANQRVLRLLSDILKDKFCAKNVTIVCSQLCALYPTESLTGLVLDCGFEESRCMATIHGCPLEAAARYVPLGNQHVLRSLREHLVARAVSISADSPQGFVTDQYLEVLLRTEGCVTLPTDPQSQEAAASVKAPPGGVSVRPPADVQSCFEPLFDLQLHLEEWCIANALLDALLACDMVTRAAVVQNIVICGGLADIPGFRQRVVLMVAQLCARCSKYSSLNGLLKNMALSVPAVPAFLVSWAGASIMASVMAAANSSI